jgi:hypothetical protein
MIAGKNSILMICDGIMKINFWREAESKNQQ